MKKIVVYIKEAVAMGYKKSVYYRETLEEANALMNDLAEQFRKAINDGVLVDFQIELCK